MIGVQPAFSNSHAEVHQQNGAKAAPLRIVTGAHRDEFVITAGQGLGIHIDSRVIVGHAIEFLWFGAVRTHRPHRLGDSRSTVDILPAVIHDPAVSEDLGAEFAYQAVTELLVMAAIGMHPMEHRCCQS